MTDIITTLLNQVDNYLTELNELTNINSRDKLAEFFTSEGKRTHIKEGFINQVTELQKNYQPSSNGYNTCCSAIQSIRLSIDGSIELSDRLIELLRMNDIPMKDCNLHHKSYLTINNTSLKLATVLVNNLRLM